MSPATFISLCTVRLECTRYDGSISVGTAFFYIAEVWVNGSVGKISMLITNKHVIQNCNSAQFQLTLCDENSNVDEKCAAENESQAILRFNNLADRTFVHPDPHVDLCAIIAADVSELVLSKSRNSRNSHLSSEDRISQTALENIRVIEPIAMIGYPSGLWDSVANRPLIRRGVTASHPLLPWNGKREFVIDAACFPGSSGSPVFLYEDQLYRNDHGSYSPGTRAQLIGVLSSGPTIDQSGKIIVRNIPTSMEPVPIVPSMMNLGYVIHADAIDDLLPIIGAAIENGHCYTQAQITLL